MTTQETWKWVPGCEGRYEISTMGRVRSHVGRSPRLLTPSANARGYVRVNLMKDGKACTIYVHRIMVDTFLGGLPDKMDTRHLNGDPSDNRLSNLKIGTRAENEEDKLKHGLSNRGERCGTAKLKEGEVRDMRARYASGEFLYMLAKEHGISRGHASHIVNRLRWGHI